MDHPFPHPSSSFITRQCIVHDFIMFGINNQQKLKSDVTIFCRIYLMYINKLSDGRNNICGKNTSSFRKDTRISRLEPADGLQIARLDIDKNMRFNILDAENALLPISN